MVQEIDYIQYRMPDIFENNFRYPSRINANSLNSRRTQIKVEPLSCKFNWTFTESERRFKKI